MKQWDAKMKVFQNLKFVLNKHPLENSLPLFQQKLNTLQAKARLRARSSGHYTPLKVYKQTLYKRTKVFTSC